MNDRAISLLEQYDIEVLRTRKGRGTFICDTDRGTILIKEYSGRPEKLKLQSEILKQVKDTGLVLAEEVLPGREGQLSVTDSDGCSYIVKTCFEGSECNIHESRECVEAMYTLAKLHRSMNPFRQTREGCKEADSFSEAEPEEADRMTALKVPFSPLREYEKHNRELNRIRSYLKKKGQKQVFEKKLLAAIGYFAEQGRQVAESWRKWEKIEDVTYCHGDYQYHNIIRTQEGWRVINFEKMMWDNPVRDIALMMRKVLEKNNWNISLGKDMLAAYEVICRLDEYDRQDLYHRFAYPEKFWKIANFYYNSGKAWIPEKNLEKLEKVILQEKEKQAFLLEIKVFLEL